MAMAMCRPCAFVTTLAFKGYRGRGLLFSSCSVRNLPNHAFAIAAWSAVRWENRRGSLLPVRAIHVSGPGSIDSPLISAMRDKIKEQLNAEEVVVQDAYGDGRHVSIDVVSASFEGQSAVNRQRMVYKAIWEELQNAVHAVDQLKTRTPTEAAKEKPRL